MNSPARLFLNPYLQIGLGAFSVTASELLMKAGADTHRATIGIFGLAALGSWFTWIGILCYLLSFASWLTVLRQLPLAIAYALINVVHILIPVGCWIFLGEIISPQRWFGIVLVLLGLLLVTRAIADVPDKIGKKI
jgi:drug/metabolite transporter (DMT)-like permease